MSDFDIWSEIPTKTKKTKQQTKIYDSNYLFQFKNHKVCNEQDMIFLSKINKIIESFKESTKVKKIAYTQTNKGNEENLDDFLNQKETDSQIFISKINNVNMSNYNETYKNSFIELDILTYEDICNIVNTIMNDIIISNKKQDIVIEIIVNYILKKNCVVNNGEEISTFRIEILNYIETKFKKYVNAIKNDKTSKEFFDLVKNYISLIKTLYINKIIGNQLVRHIFIKIENEINELLLNNKNINTMFVFWKNLFLSFEDQWNNTSNMIYLKQKIHYLKTIFNKLQEDQSYYFQNHISSKYKINFPDQEILEENDIVFMENLKDQFNNTDFDKIIKSKQEELKINV